jgi:hypothetical protein
MNHDPPLAPPPVPAECWHVHLPVRTLIEGAVGTDYLAKATEDPTLPNHTQRLALLDMGTTLRALFDRLADDALACDCERSHWPESQPDYAPAAWDRLVTVDRTALQAALYSLAHALLCWSVALRTEVPCATHLHPQITATVTFGRDALWSLAGCPTAALRTAAEQHAVRRFRWEEQMSATFNAEAELPGGNAPPPDE